MKKKSLVIISALMLIICFTQCKNNDEELLHNIVLYNQPLPTIQKYIQGKWKLEYAYGGLMTHKYIDTQNSYMALSRNNHITMGNDSYGVVVDTTIVWKREKIINNEYTYLLSYCWSGYLWPEYLIVYQIKNDTLIVKDYGDDGYDYYYTKY